MSKINFILAKSKDKIKAAARLVGQEYKREGYFPGDKIIDVPKYHWLSTSLVFLAETDGEIIATVTVIKDGELGIPIETVCRDKIGDFRKSSRQISEISQLGVDRDFLEKAGEKKREVQYTLITNLFRLVFYGALFFKTDILCIAVTPKHDVFYQSLGFSEIHPPCSYPNVNNIIALPKALDLKNVNKNNVFFRKILSSPLKESSFTALKDKIIFSIDI